MEDVIRKIRTDLRLSMDGAVAASMRQMGVKFRMIFGVGVPRLKEIARKYEPSAALAERLWEEDVRELKILATLLYPLGELSEEVATRWAHDITNQEIREQACRNLFQEAPFAGTLADSWSADSHEAVRATGYWLFARLCITGSSQVDESGSQGLLKRAVNDLGADSLLLYQSALNALRFYGRVTQERSAWVMQQVSEFESSSVSREREMYEQLLQEFAVFD